MKFNTLIMFKKNYLFQINKRKKWDYLCNIKREINLGKAIFLLEHSDKAISSNINTNILTR